LKTVGFEPLGPDVMLIPLPGAMLKFESAFARPDTEPLLWTVIVAAFLLHQLTLQVIETSARTLDDERRIALPDWLTSPPLAVKVKVVGACAEMIVPRSGAEVIEICWARAGAPKAAAASANAATTSD
jgi:hypothetical protein